MTAQELIQNPVVIGLLSTASLALIGAIAAHVIRTNAQAKALAVGGADYLAKLKELIDLAESTGLPGPEKAEKVVDDMTDWLAKQGIKGDAKKVTIERVQHDIEWLVPLMFPKKPDAAAG